MEEEPTKVGGSYPRYVKPKKKASGKSAKRPADSEEDPGTEVPTDAAGGESTRLQLEESLRLVLRAKDLDERLCRTYGSLDDLLSRAYDFAAQWRPSATVTKLNADDQDEYY
jgi:hypothetical protein